MACDVALCCLCTWRATQGLTDQSNLDNARLHAIQQALVRSGEYNQDEIYSWQLRISNSE